RLVERRRGPPAGRVRRTDAIERDARTRRGEARDRRADAGTRDRVRADLEGDRSRAERRECLEKRVDPLELGGGDVDADAEARAERAPLGPLRGRGPDDPHPDLLDERRGEREEIARLKETKAGMAPAKKRLDVAALAAPHADDRLVMKAELAVRQSCRELPIADRDVRRL